MSNHFMLRKSSIISLRMFVLPVLVTLLIFTGFSNVAYSQDFSGGAAIPNPPPTIITTSSTPLPASIITLGGGLFEPINA